MNQRDQKNHNQLRILQILRSQPGISQADISILLSLRPSTVSNLIRELKTAGMVMTVGKGASGSFGGKKADLLSLDPSYGCFGGFYLLADELVLKVLDFLEGSVDEKRISTKSMSNRRISEVLVGAIDDQLKRYKRYLGTGIAVSSVVSNQGDIVPSSHFERTLPRILSTLRSEYPALSIVVENDANALAYFDHIHRRSGYDNILHFLVRESPFTVGAGLLINGRLYRGRTGGAGEVAEELIDGGNEIETISRLIVSMQLFLDLDAVYASAENEHTWKPILEDVSAKVDIPVEYIGNNRLAVNGAAMLAIQNHVETVLPLGGADYRRDKT